MRARLFVPLAIVLVLALARPAGAVETASSPTADCGWGTFDSVGHVWPGGCWRPFADTSPFNEPLPAAPRIHGDSDALVGKLLSNGNGPGNVTAGGPSSDDYQHPVVYSKPTDPEYTIHCTVYACDDLEGQRVRIPVGARPAGGTDGHLAVVDQSSGYAYEFWQSDTPSGSGGTLDISSGGVSRVDASGSGMSLDLDGDGSVGEATAARFSLLAGIIRAEELAAGKIDHALFITIPCGAREPSHVAPAGKGGTFCSDNVDRIPMGARLRLNMTAEEIDALSVPTWKKTVLHALRTYGAYVGDTGGPESFGVMLESGTTYTAFGAPDRMVEFAQANEWDLWEGHYVGNLRNGVPWSRLQVLDTAAPTIGSVSPSGGQVGVSTTASVSVTFNEAMDRSAAEAAFSLARSSDGAPVAGTFSWSANTMTFRPRAPLAQGTAYSANVSTAARDAAGNALDTDRTWSFKTLARFSAFPSATVIQRGSLRRGGYARLASDNNSYYQVNSTRSRMRTTAWYGRLAGISNHLKSLRLTYKGRNSQRCAQTLAVWRWTTRSWVRLDSRTVGTPEVQVDKAPPGTLADYVSGTTGAGQVLARVQCTRTSSGFYTSADLLKATYERP